MCRNHVNKIYPHQALLLSPFILMFFAIYEVLFIKHVQYQTLVFRLYHFVSSGLENVEKDEFKDRK